MKKFLFVFIFVVGIAAECFSSIVIGCCYNNVSVWKYWEMENGGLKEKMLIFNQDSIPAAIQITVSKYVPNGMSGSLQNDSAFGVVGGPWEIPAYEYIIVDAPQLSLADTNDNYYKFTKILTDTLISCGYIMFSNHKPAFIEDGLHYYASQDASGHLSYDGFWWEYNSFIVESGRESTVHLNLLKKIFIKNWGEKCKLKEVLIFSWADSVRQNTIFPLNVRSGDLVSHFVYARDKLDSWHPSLEYMLACEVSPETNNSEVNKFYNIEFDIIAPPVTKPELKTVNILINCGPCTNSFYIPFIVHPRRTNDL